MKYHLVIILLLPFQLFAQQLIPKPVSYIALDGQISLDDINSIYVSDSILYADALQLQQIFTSKKLNIVYIDKHLKLPLLKNAIYLKTLKDESKSNGYYELAISKNNISIDGKGDGVFYAIISLQQMLNNNTWSCCHIIDYPNYTWRGMHLDCSRHFFSTSFVKKYIDLLALHKMNKFHWHLTDDQGWRIEIKKYPLLTTIGSKRNETILEKNFKPYQGDGKPYSGFYTQEDIKDIVAYAKAKHVTIVPEIEMPGHAVAALAAYPIYSCNQKPLQVYTTWGVSDDVFCVKDSTFHFLFDILEEVFQLFPSSYIHIGGDEVPKTRWKNCNTCQQTMKQNHLKDEHELQSYFIKKIDSFVTSKGRRIIGWDEILEGGLAPNAAVMSWRGEEGGIEAAKQKHKVVMTPGSHCYFDHYQGNKKTEPLAIGGYTPVDKVYSYNPTPTQLSDEEKKYILGAQGNIWTEYIASEKQVEYMALPRLCALSEVLWTPQKNKNYEDFTSRLLKHFELLQLLNYNYAKSIWDVQAHSKYANQGIEVTLQNDLKIKNNYLIRYTTDGNAPTKEAKIYNQAIPINNQTTLQAALFNTSGNLLGNIFSQKYEINKATGKPITVEPLPSNSYNKGGAFSLVNGIIGTLPWSGNEWLGWSGKNVDITIDLKKSISIQHVKINCLDDEASWIYLPTSIEILCSRDGKNYTYEGSIHVQDIKEMYKSSMPQFVLKPNTYRYVKLKINGKQKIPNGQPGAGEDAWLFISEIIVE